MATRYSGQLTIRLTYIDSSGNASWSNGHYHVTIAHNRRRVWHGDVLAPAVLRRDAA